MYSLEDTSKGLLPKAVRTLVAWGLQCRKKIIHKQQILEKWLNLSRIMNTWKPWSKEWGVYLKWFSKMHLRKVCSLLKNLKKSLIKLWMIWFLQRLNHQEKHKSTLDQLLVTVWELWKELKSNQAQILKKVLLHYHTMVSRVLILFLEEICLLRIFNQNHWLQNMQTWWKIRSLQPWEILTLAKWATCLRALLRNHHQEKRNLQLRSLHWISQKLQQILMLKGW